MKKCSKCKVEKELAEFYKRKTSPDGREGKCKACKKNYYQDNRSQVIARVTAYQKERAEAIAAYNKVYQKEYNAKNKERIAKRHREWLDKNLDKHRAKSHRRRALVLQAPGTLTAEDIKQRFEQHGNKCYYCGAEGKLHIEHRIPLSRGGSNHPANIVPACVPCNLSKGTRTEREFTSAS